MFPTWVLRMQTSLPSECRSRWCQVPKAGPSLQQEGREQPRAPRSEVTESPRGGLEAGGGATRVHGEHGDQARRSDTWLLLVAETPCAFNVYDHRTITDFHNEKGRPRPAAGGPTPSRGRASAALSPQTCQTRLLLREVQALPGSHAHLPGPREGGEAGVWAVTAGRGGGEASVPPLLFSQAPTPSPQPLLLTPAATPASPRASAGWASGAAPGQAP